jgi:hypothetical protein
LQEAHLPLAAIRAQLDALDDAGVAAALTTAAGAEPAAPATAADYVRQVLAGAGESPSASAQPVPPLKPSGGSRLPARSTWERIALHPDIELHVRRPLARTDQRRLEQLLEQARRIFAVEP